MGAPRITPDQKSKFVQLINENWSIKDAAEKVGVSDKWAREFNKKIKQVNPRLLEKVPLPTITGPKEYIELPDIARDCLNDFGRFRARYFGRISSPWQEDAAIRMKDLLETYEKEYVVVNCPPGSGKSTLFTHDIPCWLTCRSRTIRGFIGSSTQQLANTYVRRLRGVLERRIPMQASTEDLSKGLGRDADTTVTHDYGIFKPSNRMVPWSTFQFTVEQLGDTPVDEKEATWAAFGYQSEFLGYRVNFIVWDDLVTPDTMNTLEKIEAMQKWWHDQAETRLEPGGLLILQGQRMRSDDLYRYCLDLTTGVEEVDGQDIEAAPKKYHHIVYKAHYEELCRAEDYPYTHYTDATPYSKDGTGGCLLDPARLSWRELKGVMARPFSNYRVVYQQEDVDPSEVLVPKMWITGGRDENGVEHIGCLDRDRSIGEIPPHIPTGQRLSVLTIDPSPTKFWAIQWWLYVEPDFAISDTSDFVPTGDMPEHLGYRYLLDLKRDAMDAPALLDFNVKSGKYGGLLEDWWLRSKRLRQTYTHIIMENNAAQRFMYQYDFFRTWLQFRSVDLIPHATHRNKADPDYGVTVVKPHYKFGRVRIPYLGPETRRQSDFLIKEVTTWPNGSYDDNVMAQWFLEYQLQYLIDVVDEMPSTYNDIPSWVGPEPIYLSGV